MNTVICSTLETRKGQFVVIFLCDYCASESREKHSHFIRKRRHYCSRACYAADRKHNWSPHEQPTWKGGVSSTEAHRRWKRKNPARMAHLKARRYARERNASGSHTLDQWIALKLAHDNKCAKCREPKPLTKDHKIPLSAGGSDDIGNIQPLCRSCNSRKWVRIENPELLEAK